MLPHEADALDEPPAARGAFGRLGARLIWNTITDFGDSAAMLPAAGVLLAWLALGGQTRAAAWWAALFAGQSTLVAATKIAFRGWGVGIRAVDFTGISGHATLACSVLPIGLYLLARPAGRAVRIAAMLAGLGAGAVIGVSRVALWQHSWSEVLAGCALGGGVALLFAALADTRSRTPGLPVPAIAGALAVTLLLLHGRHAPSERLITRIALHLSGHAIPYTREPWRHAWPADASAAPARTVPQA